MPRLNTGSKNYGQEVDFNKKISRSLERGVHGFIVKTVQDIKKVDAENIKRAFAWADLAVELGLIPINKPDWEHPITVSVAVRLKDAVIDGKTKKENQFLMEELIAATKIPIDRETGSFSYSDMKGKKVGAYCYVAESGYMEIYPRFIPFPYNEEMEQRLIDAFEAELRNPKSKVKLGERKADGKTGTTKGSTGAKFSTDDDDEPSDAPAGTTTEKPPVEDDDDDTPF